MDVPNNTNVPHHVTYFLYFNEFNVIDYAVGAPGHSKDVVDGSIAVDKAYLNRMLFIIYNCGSKYTAKYVITHSCTPREKSSYASKFRDLLQDMTNESILRTSTARAKGEENAKCKVMHYNVQEKKDVNHKAVKMDLLYNLFPTNDFTKGNAKIWESSNLKPSYHY
eukprot:7135205-Ditylum_brightwellii.AAC.1